MPFGYNGKILRIDLSRGTVSVEEQEENFYRRYFGGRGFISYFLLKELKANIDPLDSENRLIFAGGVLTGAPVAGCGRNSVGAKSPLTGAYGDAEVGGYWGAELKQAGYDALIIEGRAERPIYLWLENGKAEIRDARHLWGKTTGECQSILQKELRDKRVRTAVIGLGGENLVRYACILNDLSHAAGRTGMGAVMGSKKLKAIAVRGHRLPPMAKLEKVHALSRWLKANLMNTVALFLHDQGTAVVLTRLSREGGLPTRNFQYGVFEGAQKISGKTMKDTILIGRGSCYACSVQCPEIIRLVRKEFCPRSCHCPVACKRIVRVAEPYQVNPIYGGPEYETLAALGSNCGIADLTAIAKGNELCNAYGLDTISTGATIAFAMECFENGLLTIKDTDGLDFRFGNAQAMLQMIEKIARREGIGDLLADGVARAAQKIGKGAKEFALHVKGQEIPMHEPRYKQGMGLGYIMSTTGADHSHNLHDNLYSGQGPQLEEFKALGILEPLPTYDLSPAKVRMLIYYMCWYYLLNCLVFCQFVPFNYSQIEEMVRGVTGWNTTIWEMMKVGERCFTLTHAFNIREGLSSEDALLPSRFFTPFNSGPLEGVSIDPMKFKEAKANFYSIMGWDKVTGTPTLSKLQELDIEWVTSSLGGKIGD